MCRSIKVLRGAPQPVTSDEISAAALQFVRKVSGTRKPSRINQQAFDAAVAEIARATSTLLNDMTPREPARLKAAKPVSTGGHDFREIRGSGELGEHRPQ